MNTWKNATAILVLLYCLISTQVVAQNNRSVVAQQKPVKILVFCSDAFGICHLIHQELLSHRYSTDVSSLPWQLIDTMRTENGPSLAQYDVQTLPAFIAIDRDGNVVRRKEGYANKEETVRWFRNLVFSETNLERDTDLRIDRLILEKRKEDAQWLFDQASPDIWTEEALFLFPDLWQRVDESFLQRTTDSFTKTSALLIAGDGAKREQKKEEALSLWRKAIHIILATCWLDIPKNDRAYAWLLIDLYKRLERWEEADRILQTMITAFPNDLLFSVTRVQLLLSQNERQAEALSLAEHLHEATRSRDHLYQLWTARTLAQAYTANGRKQDAIMTLTQTLASAETISFPDMRAAQAWREWQRKTRTLLSGLQMLEAMP
jgi:tetratricopeptide (TPR) repeat protein